MATMNSTGVVCSPGPTTATVPTATAPLERAATDRARRRAAEPQELARTYRQRWRVEQVIEELVNGHDLDHLVAYRLHPNRVAVAFRLLARNLAVGRQIALSGGRPDPVREPAAFRAEHLDGLGTFAVAGRTVTLAPLRPRPGPTRLRLPWTGRVVVPAA
jgi:hypothetical protein